MVDPLSLPLAVAECCAKHALGTVVSLAKLTGGLQSTVERVTTSSGATLVLKRHADAPADWYQLEAEGLEVLRSAVAQGAPRVPVVHAVARECLLLEDLSDGSPRAPDYWESFGRQLGALHLTPAPYFGFPHDNWLGLTRQVNTRMAHGAEFFIECRVLRYLREPLTEATLTAEDRAGVEKLCDRIRRETPPMPPVLCHGDLWTGNMLVGPAGRPAYIDPAVHYGLAEAELSLTRHFGGVPDAFYAAYHEANPLLPGWEDRLRWFEPKEMLGLISQFADAHNMVRPLRELVKQFA